MFGDGDLRVTSVGTAAQALAALRMQVFDCLVPRPAPAGCPRIGAAQRTIIRGSSGCMMCPSSFTPGKELRSGRGGPAQRVGGGRHCQETPRSAGPLVEKSCDVLASSSRRVRPSRPCPNQVPLSLPRIPFSELPCFNPPQHPRISRGRRCWWSTMTSETCSH